MRFKYINTPVSKNFPLPIPSLNSIGWSFDSNWHSAQIMQPAK